ncbi:MAG TPA: hypothetical protein VF998_07585 [Candidatus Limnocylindria bacterium]
MGDLSGLDAIGERTHAFGLPATSPRALPLFAQLAGPLHRERTDGVPIAEGMVRDNTPEECRCLSDDVGVLVGRSILRPRQGRLQLPAIDQRILRLVR